jgi:hypothetical protein
MFEESQQSLDKPPIGVPVAAPFPPCPAHHSVAGSESAARQRYSAAVVRYGAHFVPMDANSSGSGRRLLRYAF